MSEREAFYSVDRLERAVAVLVGDDGVGLDVLKKTLPVKVREGVVLRVRLDAAGNPDWSSATIDDAERERRLQEARERLDRLRGTDPVAMSSSSALRVRTTCCSTTSSRPRVALRQRRAGLRRSTSLPPS